MRILSLFFACMISFGLSINREEAKLIVVSPAFENEKDIPVKYTCDGENVHPAITVQNLPDSTKTLAVIMYDEDAPGGHFVHWVAFNIEPKEMIAENSNPGISGKNDQGKKGYTGPCPPSRTHFYQVEVYALDDELKLTDQADERTLKQSMQKHIIGYGKLTGRYKRK